MELLYNSSFKYTQFNYEYIQLLRPKELNAFVTEKKENWSSSH